jgi:hypothetical protein
MFPFKYKLCKSETERWRSQARSVGLSHTAKNRLEWIIHHQEYNNARLTCRHFGIKPRTFYKWKNLFDEKNLRTLEDRSRKPEAVRQTKRTPEQEIQMIALRKEFIRLGAKKLAKIYESRFGKFISAYQFESVIKKYRLYYNPQKNERARKKRRNSVKKLRITNYHPKKKPFKLFEVDTIVLHWCGVKVYILTAIDRLTRVAFSRAYSSHSSRAAADFLKRLRMLVGDEFAVVPDNGSEFHGEFLKAAKEMQLTVAFARVRQPKDKPQVERFNRTLQDEFIALGNNHISVPELNRRMTKWLVHYNFERPHQSLRYLAPLPWLVKFYPRVLPMYPVHTEG